MGYAKCSSLQISIHKDFETFELYEKRENSPITLIYPFFSYLCLTNFVEIVLFESSIDVLDFLKEYSSAFTLLREDYLAQRALEREDD